MNSILIALGTRLNDPGQKSVSDEVTDKLTVT
jgi:hypothetical protein